MAEPPSTIDALDQTPPLATIGTRWELITDSVMGGISSAKIPAVGRWSTRLRMRGDVSLENNGGFVQVALDLAPEGGAIDASRWTGIEIDVVGNGERYNLHLRTEDVVRPWQSYRAEFFAPSEWRTIRLPFAGFEPHELLPVSLDIALSERRSRWTSRGRPR